MACNGPKMGSFHLFVHPRWCRIILGKTHFRPFLTHFLSQTLGQLRVPLMCVHSFVADNTGATFGEDGGHASFCL